MAQQKDTNLQPGTKKLGMNHHETDDILNKWEAGLSERWMQMKMWSCLYDCPAAGAPPLFLY